MNGRPLTSPQDPQWAYRATLVAAALAAGCCGTATAARADGHRWSEDRAVRWQGDSRPWPSACGAPFHAQS